MFCDVCIRDGRSDSSSPRRNPALNLPPPTISSLRRCLDRAAPQRTRSPGLWTWEDTRRRHRQNDAVSAWHRAQASRPGDRIDCAPLYRTTRCDFMHSTVTPSQCGQPGRWTAVVRVTLPRVSRASRARLVCRHCWNILSLLTYADTAYTLVVRYVMTPTCRTISTYRYEQHVSIRLDDSPSRR